MLKNACFPRDKVLYYYGDFVEVLGEVCSAPGQGRKENYRESQILSETDLRKMQGYQAQGQYPDYL